MTAAAITSPSSGEYAFYPAGPGKSLMKLRRQLFRETLADGKPIDLPDSVPLSRFFSFVRKLGVQTIAVDRPHQSWDIEEENEDLAIYGRFADDHRVVRIVAFSAVVADVDDLRKLPPDELARCVLGVAVWKEDEGRTADGQRMEVCARIFESVVRRGDEAHNYSRLEPVKRIPYADGLELQIRGHLFCQQNSMTNVCAHAALRSLLDAVGVPMSFRDINRIAGVDHRTRRLQLDDPKGLIQDEILQVLRDAGLHPQYSEYHVATPDEAVETVPWQDRIYAGAESGFPSLLVFGSRTKSFYHIMPVFGHTMNRDMWVPRAEPAYYENTGFFSIGRFSGFQPSHLWLSAFVVHDDGLGQNYCLPKFYLPPMKQLVPPGTAYKDDPYGWPYEAPWVSKMRHGANTSQDGMPRLYPVQEADNGVAFVISVRPPGVATDGAIVQRGALALLRRLALTLERSGEWGGRVFDALKPKQIVLRPLLIQRSDYLAHLRSTDDWKEDGPQTFPEWNLEKIEALLPEPVRYFWMVEFSIPELFPANLRKVGELILRCEFDPDEDRWYRCAGQADASCALIMARIPGQILIPKGEGRKTRDPAIAGDSGPVIQFECESLDCPLTSHTALFGAEPEKEKRES